MTEMGLGGEEKRAEIGLGGEENRTGIGWGSRGHVRGRTK